MRLGGTFEEADKAPTKPVGVKYLDCPKTRG